MARRDSGKRRPNDPVPAPCRRTDLLDGGACTAPAVACLRQAMTAWRTAGRPMSCAHGRCAAPRSCDDVRRRWRRSGGARRRHGRYDDAIRISSRGHTVPWMRGRVLSRFAVSRAESCMVARCCALHAAAMLRHGAVSRGCDHDRHTLQPYEAMPMVRITPGSTSRRTAGRRCRRAAVRCARSAAAHRGSAPVAADSRG